MSTAPKSAECVLVAGDVCVDVVGLPMAPKSVGDLIVDFRLGDVADQPIDNWRLTGEIRTSFLPGGTLLTEQLIRAALGPGGPMVCGPQFPWPTALNPKIPTRTGDLSSAEFMELAERLTRTEVVHSLLTLGEFEEAPKMDSKRLRVAQMHGFSGPRDLTLDPAVTPLPPLDLPPSLVVLDDTGNRFRRSPDQWPAALKTKGPTILHKVHRPLPGHPKASNPLWSALRAHADNHVVVASVDDLREAGALISRGLSWERTALDLVSQLLHVEAFSELRRCRYLIVRLGLDGAVLWSASNQGGDSSEFLAELIYDPAAIEGTVEQSRAGDMVGYGSAFVAGLVRALAFQKPTLDVLKSAVVEALTISRRMLHLGFGSSAETPHYPGAELFQPMKGDPFLATASIPVVIGTTNPDRGYWRLLETVFADKTDVLNRAVDLTAIGDKSPLRPEDQAATDLLKRAPIATFAKALRTHDRREIEAYRALFSLMRDYVRLRAAPRPLSVAVFGPPGAGKSFGIKKVAEELQTLGGKRKIVELTFNLSQYQTAEELAAAFHLVRDCALRGEVPLVFFDEFDSSLNGKDLGWLRYFLSPMQDATFLDRGAPHPIGQAIFVFAGGTADSYRKFAERCAKNKVKLKGAKVPDFLSRLRATLDIPSLDLEPEFDAYDGQVEEFPCTPAILLRRANILAFQLREKAPHLLGAREVLRVGHPVLRALLHIPKFEHGNRSFEAMLDMSHLHDGSRFVSSMLPAPGHTELHTNRTQLTQLLASSYPFTEAERETIAEEIHKRYLSQQGELNPDKPSHKPWGDLDKRFKQSNRNQADDIPRKLRMAGRWYRKRVGPVPSSLPALADAETIQRCARLEHDRWVADQRRRGYTYGEKEDHQLRTHPSIIRWCDPRLSAKEKAKDTDTIEAIPHFLSAAGFEVIDGEEVAKPATKQEP